MKLKSKLSVVSGLFLFFIAGEAHSAPKLIFHGWDTMDVTPSELLAHADEIAACGSDGFAIPIVTKNARGERLASFHMMNGARWTWADVAPFLPQLSAISRKKGLQSSMLHFWGQPRPRLDWRDDAAWDLAANNLGVLARLAKEAGLKGLNLDAEDYFKSRQYFWLPEKDGTWKDTLRFARRRGAQFFGTAFREFPDMDLLSFFFFALDSEYGKTVEDPVLAMCRKKDLWPAFLNGMLDAMPPTVRICDGDENAYHYEAARHDFYRASSRQLTALLPLVAKENRAKYRAQNMVGFGFYVDGYAAPTNSPWHVPMVDGSRVNALDVNMREAVSASDGYIWIYGEKHTFIDWKLPLSNPRMNRWKDVKTWEEPLPGFRDVLDANVRPLEFVARKRTEQRKAGTYVNLLAGKGPGADGNVCLWPCKCPDGSWYAVSFDMKGYGRALTSWMGSKGWMWELSSSATFGPADANGVRHGVILARTPKGGASLFVCLDGNTKERREVEFSNLEVIRVR